MLTFLVEHLLSFSVLGEVSSATGPYHLLMEENSSLGSRLDVGVASMWCCALFSCVFKGPKLEPPELGHLSSPGVLLLKFLNVILFICFCVLGVVCYATPHFWRSEDNL